MSWQSVVFLFCLAGFVSGCAMSDEMSLAGALDGETQAAASVAPSDQDRPVQSTAAADAKVAGASGAYPTDDEKRAATMAHLKALALANQKRQGGSLSTSVAELKRLQATHGDVALSEISAGNTAQN